MLYAQVMSNNEIARPLGGKLGSPAVQLSHRAVCKVEQIQGKEKAQTVLSDSPGLSNSLWSGTEVPAPLTGLIIAVLLSDSNRQAGQLYTLKCKTEGHKLTAALRM